VDIMTEDDDFEWKGLDCLTVRSCQFRHPLGYRPYHILQLDPPSSITCLAINTDWGLVAAGTAFGFIIFDIKCQRLVSSKATVNAVIESSEDNPLTGTNNSIKNSLRESFNRIRRSHTARVHEKKRLQFSSETTPLIPENDVPDSCLPERRVIAEDGSLVRSLHFSCTFIENTVSTCPTLWVGTNSGLVMVLSLSIPNTMDTRQSDGIMAVLAKEIQLQHRAPVLDIEVLDARGHTLTKDNESIGASALPHKVLICSEEQFKLFSLPGLAACGKYKVTANEGVVVRRSKATTFASLANSSISENCLLFISNLGEISAFSLPDLKCQMKVTAVRSDNHLGISSFVFSNTGKGLYLSSCNELQELSVAAADGCSSMIGRVPLKYLGRDTDSQIFREQEVIERSDANTVKLMSADAGGSEMSTSMNSDASYDIDIVRHHDVATSTANLLDASDSDSETETESEEEQSRYGKSKSSTGVGAQGVQGDDGLHAWLGVSWLIMYLMFVLFLLYKRKANVQAAVR